MEIYNNITERYESKEDVDYKGEKSYQYFDSGYALIKEYDYKHDDGRYLSYYIDKNDKRLNIDVKNAEYLIKYPFFDERALVTFNGRSEFQGGDTNIVYGYIKTDGTFIQVKGKKFLGGKKFPFTYVNEKHFNWGLSAVKFDIFALYYIIDKEGNLLNTNPFESVPVIAKNFISGYVSGKSGCGYYTIKGKPCLLKNEQFCFFDSLTIEERADIISVEDLKGNLYWLNKYGMFVSKKFKFSVFETIDAYMGEGVKKYIMEEFL